MSNSLQPHGLQHARPPCTSLSLRVCSDSRLLSGWCHPTISPSVTPFSSCSQSFPPSGSFPMSWLHIRWPKYYSFSFSINPSKEHSELISFRIDWFDLLAVRGTLKNLLQNHSLKVWVLLCSALFMVQVSHLYMTTGKTIALIIRTFVSKVILLEHAKHSRLLKRKSQ